MKEGTHSDEEIRRRNARNALERYTHYYERYHAHDVARKKANEALTGSLQHAVAQVSEVTKLPLGQMRFLGEARPLPTPCRFSSPHILRSPVFASSG